MTQGLLSRKLLDLLLGVTESCAEFNPLNTYSAAESGAIGADSLLVYQFKVDLVLRLLTPFDEFALVVVILLGDLG